MGEDVKAKDGGPDEARRPREDDTEGHRKKLSSVTDDPGLGPDEAKRMPRAIPDSDDDTVGHKR